MIYNIVDRRSHPYRWKRVDGVIEPTYHDNVVPESDLAPINEDLPAYDSFLRMALSDVVSIAQARPYPLTLYLYDAGTAETIRE